MIPFSVTASTPTAATSSSIVVASGALDAMNSWKMFLLLGAVPRRSSMNVILTLKVSIVLYSCPSPWAQGIINMIKGSIPIYPKKLYMYIKYFLSYIPHIFTRIIYVSKIIILDYFSYIQKNYICLLDNYFRNS